MRNGNRKAIPRENKSHKDPAESLKTNFGSMNIARANLLNGMSTTVSARRERRYLTDQTVLLESH